MRWLVAAPGPGFSVFDCFVGWTEALEEIGEQVHPWNLDDRLVYHDRAYLLVDEERGLFRKAVTGDVAVAHALNDLAAALWKLHPHVLFVVSGFFTDYDLLDHARRYGTQVVLLATESPYEDDRQLLLAEHVDLVLLNDPTNLERFRAVTRAEYMPHAYRPTLHHPGPAVPALACDLAFVGTGYPSRIAFFEAMNLDGVNVKLGGNWMRLGADIGGELAAESPLRQYLAHDLDGCMDNEDAAELYRSAKVGLNLYRREAAHPELEQGWAVGPREVEMAACGLFFLRDPRPEGDELFGFLPTFDTPQDASDQLRHYLRHEHYRAKLATRAREAIQDRTFVNNAKRLIGLLDRAPVTR
jgi:spore maturation protein CgeB